jgi:LysM repeat protein
MKLHRGEKRGADMNRFADNKMNAKSAREISRHIVKLLGILIFCFTMVGARSLQPKSFFEATVTPESHNATADELVYFTNLRRTQYGLSALTVNSTLMAVAQQTADIMAGNQLTWHIGGVSERLSAAGYGSGVTVWATENVANGTNATAEELVYVVWNDDTHNIPVMNPIYCDIGAGVATDSEGTSYYVIHAAYTEKRYCGEYRAPDGTTLETIYADQWNNSDDAETPETNEVSQFMQPVSRVTPNADGVILHEVTYGQTLWSIAITYGTRILEIQALNGMTEDDLTVYPGQILIIPTSLTPYPTKETTDTPQPQPTINSGISSRVTITNSLEEAINETVQNENIEASKNSSSLSMVIFWIVVGGLLLILFGVLSRFLPYTNS